MNALIASSRRSRLVPSTRLCFWIGLAALLSAATPLALRAQTDDFNDGNDTGWTRYSPLAQFGVPGIFSFPNGGYRIQTTTPTGSALNPPRAGSVREDVTYTDFYVAVDVVHWKDDTRQAFGLLARVGTPGLGTTTGYAFTYERGSGVTMTSGDTDLSRIENEGPTPVPTGPSSFHLDSAKQYRFVFVGKGPNLEGRIYELPNTATPVLAISGANGDFTSGYCGLVVYDNSGGTGVCDATFDNYFATDVEPPRLTLTDLFFGDIKVCWPLPSTGFRLQYSTVLPAISWTEITDDFIFDDSQSQTRCHFTDTRTGNKFFRLIKP